MIRCAALCCTPSASVDHISSQIQDDEISPNIAGAAESKFGQMYAYMRNSQVPKGREFEAYRFSTSACTLHFLLLACSPSVLQFMRLFAAG
jgi:hypothetical protein